MQQTTTRPPAPRTIALDDPRLQTPPSRVGELVTDQEAPDWAGVIVWDPTYRNPSNWGYSRGLLMADEGASNCLREERVQ